MNFFLKINKLYIFFVIIFISYSFFKFLGIWDFYKLGSEFGDFKWSGSNLFLNHKDIYQIYLSGNYKKLILKTQFPNYSIGEIYFHLPFGLFTFDVAKIIWFIFINILIIHIYLILINADLILKDQKLIIFLVMILFIFSKPLNMLLSNGNFSIICLWGFIFYFLSKKNNYFISLFISSIKYSFAPIIFFYSFLKKRFLSIILVFLLTLLLLFHYSVLFDVNIFKLSYFPILIVSKTTASGLLDLQTLMGNYPSNMFFRYFILILISFIIFYYIFTITKRDNLFDLSIVSVLTLLFYKHVYYDLVFLLPVLIYAFRLQKNYKLIIFLIIFYFWFICYLDYFHYFRYWKTFMLSNFLILSSMLYILIKSNLKKM